jgi:hypothetical protein
MRSSDKRGTIKRLVDMQLINQNFIINFVFSLILYVNTHNILKQITFNSSKLSNKLILTLIFLVITYKLINKFL